MSNLCDCDITLSAIRSVVRFSGLGSSSWEYLIPRNKNLNFDTKIGVWEDRTVWIAKKRQKEILPDRNRAGDLSVYIRTNYSRT